MKTTEHGIEDSKDVENIYHMRLMTLLQELVREKGYKGAARVLEIDQATVTESAKTGQLTRRVRQALERALQEGVGSAAERQRQRNEQLEERVEGVRPMSRAWRARWRPWARRRAGGCRPSRARWRPCVGTTPRGPGPGMPAPVLRRRKRTAQRGVRRAGAGNPRRSRRCGGSTPTWRRGSRPRTTRRYSAKRGR